MKFRDIFGGDLGVWKNETIDESKENLGKPESKFVDVEDVPDHSKTPDQILMDKEDAMLANDESLLPRDPEDEELPSQWEIDLEKEKYAGDNEEKVVDDAEPTIIPTFHGQNIGIKSQLHELSKEDIEARFNQDASGQTHNSKPYKPERDSIRFN